MVSTKHLLLLITIIYMVLVMVLLFMMANIKEETERLCDYYINSYCECADPDDVSYLVPNFSIGNEGVSQWDNAKLQS